MFKVVTRILNRQRRYLFLRYTEPTDVRRCTGTITQHFYSLIIIVHTACDISKKAGKRRRRRILFWILVFFFLDQMKTNYFYIVACTILSKAESWHLNTVDILLGTRSFCLEGVFIFFLRTLIYIFLRFTFLYTTVDKNTKLNPSKNGINYYTRMRCYLLL